MASNTQEEQKYELILRLQHALNQRIYNLNQKVKKRYLKDADIDLENSINRVFKQSIDSEGATKLTIQCIKMQYYNIETRQACINEFGKNIKEREHLEKTYNTILNRVYRKWNNHIDYLISQEKLKQEKIELETQKKQLEEQKAQLEKEQKWKWLKIICIVLWNIIKWTFIIVFGAIILLFHLLLDISPYAGMSNSKKGRKK